MTGDFYFGDGQISLPRHFRHGDLWVPPVPNAPDGDAEYADLTIEGDPKNPNKPNILGAGAMFGPVVGATLSNGHRVAVKLFLPIKEEFDRSVLYDHAAHEYRRASKDLGPRFVRARALFETDEDGAALFLMVMDRINGLPLSRAGLPRIESAQQVKWTGQMIDALSALQAHEVIWQDIKPDNLMLDDVRVNRANLVFIDHGSSRKLHAGTHTNQQHTPSYLAPECLTKQPGRERFTHRSDLFSAGVTLLEVFTQGNPYLDSQDVDYRTVRGTPNVNSPLIDPDVREVLKGMLIRDPARRPTLDELAAVLQGRPPSNWNPDPYATWAPAGEDTTPSEGDQRFDPTRPASVRVPPATFTPIKIQTVTEPETDTTKIASNPKPHDDLDDPQLLQLLYPTTPPADGSLRIRIAGVDPRWVVASHDRNAYKAVGVALVVYFAYILVGSAAVGYQMSGSVFHAVVGFFVVGPLVGLALVNLDRTIVGSISPNLDKLGDAETTRNKPIKRTVGFWTGLLVRTLVALMASFVIGDAINVQLHANDVAAQITTERDQRVAALKAPVNALFQGEVEAAQAVVTAAQKARDAAEGAGDQYRLDATAEQQGTTGTGKRGCGPVCMGLIDQATKADAAWERDRASLEKALSDAKAAASAVETKKQSYLAEETKKIEDEVSGPVARARALFDFATKDPLTAFIYWAVILVFVAIELSAILIKLLNLNNHYERDSARRVRLAEYAALKEYEAQIQHVDLTADANWDITQDMVWLKSATQGVKIQKQAAKLAQQLGVTPPARNTATV